MIAEIRAGEWERHRGGYSSGLNRYCIGLGTVANRYSAQRCFGGYPPLCRAPLFSVRRERVCTLRPRVCDSRYDGLNRPVSWSEWAGGGGERESERERAARERGERETAGYEPLELDASGIALQLVSWRLGPQWGNICSGWATTLNVKPQTPHPTPQTLNFKLCRVPSVSGKTVQPDSWSVGGWVHSGATYVQVGLLCSRRGIVLVESSGFVDRMLYNLANGQLEVAFKYV